MHLIIHQVLTSKILLIFTKNVLQNHIFLAINATLPSDSPSHFRKNLLERIWKLFMTINDKIRNEKLQYKFNREAGKILALSSGKRSSIKTNKDTLRAWETTS